MKHKVAELEGALLDAAVALACGWPFVMDSQPDGEQWCCVPRAYIEDRDSKAHSRRRGDLDLWRPSTEWPDGGPIIERERITVAVASGAAWFAEIGAPWHATGIEVGYGSHQAEGPTPLIAAMRAFVASKFGGEVELP